MIFFFKLFLTMVKARKKYLYLALLPPLVFLLLAVFFPHSYRIHQDITAADHTLLSPGPNPMDMVTVESVLNNPQSFFTDNQVLMDLRENLLTGDAVERPEWAQWLPSRFAVHIKRTVLQDMSLESTGENKLTMSYQGRDRELGEALVNFYSQRLVWAGERAQRRALTRPGADQADGTGPAVALEGGPSVETSRTLLTWDRLTTAFWVLLVSLLAALAFIWFKESTRPKLYSERQAARYLGVPVLGSIPNMDRLARFQ